MMFLAVLGLYIVIDGFTNMDGFQHGQDGKAGVLAVIVSMVSYYSIHTSLFFDMTAGPLAVITALSVLALAAKHHELYAVFSSGIPAYRLLMPLGLGVLLVSALMTLNQEFLIPSVSHRLMSQHGQGNDKGRPLQPLYDRHHVHIAGSRVFPAEKRVSEIAISLPSPEMTEQLTTIHAAEATYFPATKTTPQGFLLKQIDLDLKTVQLTDYGTEQLKISPNQEEAFLVTDVSIDQLCDREHALRLLATRELANRVQQSSGLFANNNAPQLLLHSRLTRPLVMLCALFLAAPIVLRRESRSLMLNMACGMFAVVTLLMMGMITESFVHTNLITAAQAAWIPCLIGGMGASWMKDLIET